MCSQISGMQYSAIMTFARSTGRMEKALELLPAVPRQHSRFMVVGRRGCSRKRVLGADFRMPGTLPPCRFLYFSVNKFTCQYALRHRFCPFVETGEFANVGVVLLSPEGRFFGYKLLKKYGRITQFFHQLDRKVYLDGKALFLEELERFAAHLRQHALDGRKRTPDIALSDGTFCGNDATARCDAAVR